MHVAVVDGALTFHGGQVGEKLAFVGRDAVVSTEETVATLPSYFFDAERACPATTYYRSAMAWGRLREVKGPAKRARVLAGLMDAMQPEGGFAPLDPNNPLYTTALARLAVLELVPERLLGRRKLGQHKPKEVMEGVLEGLWRRGDPGDLAALEAIRSAHPDTLRPPFLSLPGARLVVQPSAGHRPGAVDLLEHQYWNQGISRDVLSRALVGSDAWVVAEDRGRWLRPPGR